MKYSLRNKQLQYTYITRSKANKAMKFDQSECNMRNNIFQKKLFNQFSSQNVVQKLFSDHFQQKQNLAYFWIDSLKFSIVCLYCMEN